jgi:hypothetical protein
MGSGSFSLLHEKIIAAPNKIEIKFFIIHILVQMEMIQNELRQYFIIIFITTLK